MFFIDQVIAILDKETKRLEQDEACRDCCKMALIFILLVKNVSHIRRDFNRLSLLSWELDKPKSAVKKIDFLCQFFLSLELWKDVYINKVSIIFLFSKCSYILQGPLQCITFIGIHH